MDPARAAPDPAIRAAVQMLDITAADLWAGYFALGGSLPALVIVNCLAGRTGISDGDHDKLALVLNERFAEQGNGYPIEYYGGADLAMTTPSAAWLASPRG